MLGSSSESWVLQGSLAPLGGEERFGVAVTSLLLAIGAVSWLYGVYCYVQMVRHRRPGVPRLSMMWPAAFLTERGREYRRRALRSYGLFAVLGLLLILWGWLHRG
jgi:hypothetical protein